MLSKDGDTNNSLFIHTHKCKINNVNMHHMMVLKVGGKGSGTFFRKREIGNIEGWGNG